MSATASPTVAVAIICKTPAAGRSKTRLSPPLRPEECAEISSCFIRDLAATIGDLGPGVRGFALYTPGGTEAAIRALLPPGFGLLLQGDGDLGDRLCGGIGDLLGTGCAGAVIVGSDSPTLPPALLRAAVETVRGGDGAVIVPALDGGYVLIALSRQHHRLFEDITWSTDVVLEQTLERAREAGVPVTVLPPWYDVDDAESYAMLEAELGGSRPPFADPSGVPRDAPATRAFVERRRAARSAA